MKRKDLKVGLEYEVKAPNSSYHRRGEKGRLADTRGYSRARSRFRSDDGGPGVPLEDGTQAKGYYRNSDGRGGVLMWVTRKGWRADAVAEEVLELFPLSHVAKLWDGQEAAWAQEDAERMARVKAETERMDAEVAEAEADVRAIEKALGYRAGAITVSRGTRRAYAVLEAEDLGRIAIALGAKPGSL